MQKQNFGVILYLFILNLFYVYKTTHSQLKFETAVAGDNIAIFNAHVPTFNVYYKQTKMQDN